MTEKTIVGSSEAQALRDEALQEIQRKVGCLYQWMWISIVLMVLGFLLDACNWLGW